MKRETTNAGPTPGPWVAGWTGNVGEPGLGRPCVGTVGAADWVGPEGAGADARLIAAAPDLYAALRGLMLGRWGVRIDAEDPETAATLRAALSRAEGNGGAT